MCATKLSLKPVDTNEVAEFKRDVDGSTPLRIPRHIGKLQHPNYVPGRGS